MEVLQDYDFFNSTALDDSAISYEDSEISMTSPPNLSLSTGFRSSSWLPNTEIKDFDDFLKSTLKDADISSQGLRSSSMKFSISATTFGLIVAVRFSLYSF